MPNEDSSDIVDAGLVHFLYSADTGTVTGTRSKVVRQGANNVLGKVQRGDNFGSEFGFDLPPTLF